MQEHNGEHGTGNAGTPNVVPADSGAPFAFPGTESIEGTTVESSSSAQHGPRKPSWAERRAARQATSKTESADPVKGLFARVPWDVRAKLAVVLSFVILVTVLILNRPWLKGKETKQKLVAQIPNHARQDPGEKKETEPSLPEPKTPPIENKDAKDTPKVDPEPAPEVKSESPPPLPSSDPKEKQAEEKNTTAVATKPSDVPPVVPGVAKPSSASTEEPPTLPAVPKDEPKPHDAPPSMDTPPTIIGEAKPVEVAPVHEPPVELVKPEVKPVEAAPSTMPALAPTPSTTEAPKETQATPSGGGFVIPSAGLLRGANANASKKAPVSNETILAVAAPPRAVPAAPAEAGQTDAANGEIHVVRRGENFWTISRYHYASGRFYRALWYANRDLVKSPEDLYVGTPIRIPQVEDLNREMIEVPKTARANGRPSAEALPRSSARDSKTQKASTKSETGTTGTLPVVKEPEASSPIPINPKRTARRAEEPQYRTYVVRGRNETLRSIARSELGDSEREDEIYRLNESEFEDDSYKLRVGMTLKIPDETRKR